MQERGSDGKFYIQLQQYKKKKKIQSSKPDSIFYSCWHILYIYWHSSDSGVFPLDTIISYSPQAQPPPRPHSRPVGLYVSNIVPCLSTLGYVHSPHIEKKKVFVQAVRPHLLMWTTESTSTSPLCCHACFRHSTLSGLLFLVWLCLLPHLLWTHGTTEEQPCPRPPLQVGLGTVPEVCVHTDQINWTLWSACVNPGLGPYCEHA